jgi:hypothetical protein
MSDVDCLVDDLLRLSFLEQIYKKSGSASVKKEIDLLVYDGTDLQPDPLDKDMKKELLETLVKNKKDANYKKNKDELDLLIYDGTDLKSGRLLYEDDYKDVFPCKTLGLK